MISVTLDPVPHSTRTHHRSLGWGQGGKASRRATQPGDAHTPRRGQGLATSGSLPPPPEQRMTPRVPTMRSQECEFTKSAKSPLARCTEQEAEQPPSKYGESRPLVRKACASGTHNKSPWRRTRWDGKQETCGDQKEAYLDHQLHTR